MNENVIKLKMGTKTAMAPASRGKENTEGTPQT